VEPTKDPGLPRGAGEELLDSGHRKVHVGAWSVNVVPNAWKQDIITKEKKTRNHGKY
jgi:hypothetical protein